jgi:hypothetical protein
MKLLKTTLSFAILAACAATMNAESALVDVHVPFAFEAAGKAMPAGTYTIGQPTSGGVIMIRGDKANSAALVLAVNAGPTVGNKAGVTFKHVGSAVVLSTIEVPGASSYNVVVPESRTAAAVKVALPRK